MKIKTIFTISFWQGKQDNNVPYEWANYMSEKIEGSCLNEFPDEGHLLLFEHANEIFSNLKPTMPKN